MAAFTQEHKDRIAAAVTKSWTPERRKWMSEKMSQIRADRFWSGVSETRSQTQTGRLHTEIAREHMSEAQRKRSGFGAFAWHGGATGDALWKKLEPKGYERERFIRWGPARYDMYKVDFLHRARKIVIELDGPWHDDSADGIRDKRLKDLGYRIIRIRH